MHLQFTPLNPEWPQFVQDAARAWGAPVVDRSAVAEFSGRMLNPRTMANADSMGKGPSEKIIQGKRRVGYPLKALCDWWASRVKVVPGKVQSIASKVGA